MGNPSHETSDQEVSDLAQRLSEGFLGTLPFLVAGLFLLLVLPPVGVVFLLFGIGTAVWGSVQQLITGGGDDAGDRAPGHSPT